jgi:hypothetical protein
MRVGWPHRWSERSREEELLPLLGLELRPLGSLARSQSLYPLRYPRLLVNVRCRFVLREVLEVESFCFDVWRVWLRVPVDTSGINRLALTYARSYHIEASQFPRALCCDFETDALFFAACINKFRFSKELGSFVEILYGRVVQTVSTSLN